MHRQIAGKLTGPVTKWIVLLVVLVAAGGLGGFAGKLTDVQDNEASSWLPASAESTKAFKELEKIQDTQDVTTTVVYYRKGGLTDADLAAINSQGAEIAKVRGVVKRGNDQLPAVITPAIAAGIAAQSPDAAKALGPFVSSDGTVAKVELTQNFGDKLWYELPKTAKDIRKLSAIDGVQVYVAGFGGSIADQASIFTSFDGKLLFITLGVVILILLFTYRSPILWLLPIFCAAVSLGISMGLLYLLAKYAGLTVNGQTQFILTVLVIGAGTDYALLLIARYREELRRHENRHEAMAFALHRAAPAIFASSATVVVGLLCLLFAELNSTAGLGPANAIGVAVTSVVMMTLLPALLVICGRWIFWPQRPTYGSSEPTAAGFWAKVGDTVSRRPRAVWLVTGGVLLLLCLGALRLDTAGLASDDTYTKKVDSVTGQKVMQEHGLVDATSPIQVVTKADQADAVRQAMSGVDGAADPSDPFVVGDLALITANPTNPDPLSTEAFDAVRSMRDAVHAVPGADAKVTGSSALTLDVEHANSRDSKVIVPIVLVAVFLILMLLLRALLAPLLLIGTVILSFAAAFGLSGLVFDFIYGHHHTDSGYPLMAFVFLVALGIDYNIFLMTRVREEALVHGTRRGSLIALSSTGGVITSAGFVLAATFAALATMPLVFTLQLGTTIALGVLLDTMIVRSVLVTALNLDLGGKIWWPSRLDRGPGSTDTAAPEAPEADRVPAGV
ncbi:MMPL family transporter [Nocardioides ginsengisoli]|uniref:MMPL family transporter n=1 Tax=Nocardioides ginsengisoli TaxID=363868 RepID=A0ABW3VVI9_9ACTN